MCELSNEESSSLGSYAIMPDYDIWQRQKPHHKIEQSDKTDYGRPDLKLHTDQNKENETKNS